MNNNAAKYQRRDYFVKKWMQLKFSLYFIVFVIIVNLLFGYFIYDEIKYSLNQYIYNPHLKNITNTWEEIISPVVWDTSKWPIITLITLFILIILYITMRFSRGLNVIQKDLNQLNNDDFTQEFRSPKLKELNTLSSDYKQMKAFLRSNVGGANECLSKLESVLSKLEDCADKQDTDGVRSSLEELEYYYNKLDHHISNFNV